MPEQINEYRPEELTVPESKDSAGGLPMAENSGSKNLIAGMEGIQHSLASDTPVSNNQVKQLEQSLSEMTVNVGGLNLSAQKLKDYPELKEHMDYFEKIMSGFDITEILRKVKWLTPEVVARLCGPYGDRSIFLPSLTDLPPEIAKAFTEHCTQGLLQLTSVTQISPETAKLLGEFKGNELVLGLTDLQPDIASYLSASHGVLTLSNLREITNEAARALVNHKGGLELPGLRNISAEAADYLSHGSDLSISDPYVRQLNLVNVKEIDGQTAEYLARNHHLIIGLTEMSPLIANYLGKIDGELKLYRLNSLSKEAAEGLAAGSLQSIELKGEIDISDEVVDILAKNVKEVICHGKSGERISMRKSALDIEEIFGKPKPKKTLKTSLMGVMSKFSRKKNNG